MTYYDEITMLRLGLGRWTAPGAQVVRPPPPARPRPPTRRAGGGLLRMFRHLAWGGR
jgi:hypothetical protein